MFASKTLLPFAVAAALFAGGCSDASAEVDPAAKPDPAQTEMASPQATWVVYTLPG